MSRRSTTELAAAAAAADEVPSRMIAVVEARVEEPASKRGLHRLSLAQPKRSSWARVEQVVPREAPTAPETREATVATRPSAALSRP